MTAAVLAVTTAADHWDGDEVREQPGSASAVEQRYWLGAGEQVIDLTRVVDLDALDGREIEVEGGIGRIEVILPDGLAATVTGDVDGPGHLDLFGEERSGIDIHDTVSSGSDLDPEITIDAQLGVGQIEVSHR